MRHGSVPFSLLFDRKNRRYDRLDLVSESEMQLAADALEAVHRSRQILERTKDFHRLPVEREDD